MAVSPLPEDPAFGTSGLRGLVTALTPSLVAAYARAFAHACPVGDTVHLGWDLRPSSEGIAGHVATALRQIGLDVVLHGTVPTPALALEAMARGHGAVMVTGSHIPADRNGLKFYTMRGELTKTEERAVVAAFEGDAGDARQRQGEMGGLRQSGAALAGFMARYRRAYGAQALSGLRIGVYHHSTVARDMLPPLLAALGATPVGLGRSETFVPVDTEAIDAPTRAQLALWCAEHRLDAIISADGDADRPLMTDGLGTLLPGDVLGAITAQAIGAETVCTPVSSNSLIARLDGVTVIRTRIGSPYVIAAMEAHCAAAPASPVVGYEANGGFLLGFAAQGPAGPLPPLMTRDFLLPILAPLARARAQGVSLAELRAGLPALFTAADRVQNVPVQDSGAFLAGLIEDSARRNAFFADMPPDPEMDLTDGLRLRFANAEVVHLRPSGNAPECRCYTEAATPARAAQLVARYLDRMRNALLP